MSKLIIKNNEGVFHLIWFSLLNNKYTPNYDGIFTSGKKYLMTNNKIYDKAGVK